MVECTRCKASLPTEQLDTPDWGVCPECNSAIQVATFPALVTSGGPGVRGAILLDTTEASCFYHPTKQAMVTCDHCGRFLCALCAVSFSQRHLCPVCIEAGQNGQHLREMIRSKIRYDKIALALAVLGTWGTGLLWQASDVAGGISLALPATAAYLAIRSWPRPVSVVHTTRWRQVVAIIIAVATILGWGLALAGKWL